ncbi:hypothetical protein C6497_14040 [Candidatus Poribacteria bacterium]|nr:MAG: hypothetical protein C6497_14040 [Candidatus Poribacteria bacterium]
MSMLKSNNNECKSIQNDLSAYLDKEIAPWKQLRIQRHLKQCSVCSSQVNILQNTNRTLCFIEPIKASENFIDAVMSKANTQNIYNKEKAEGANRILNIINGLQLWLRSNISVSNPVFMFSFIFGLFIMIGVTLYSPQIEKLNLFTNFNSQSIDNSQDRLISFEVITQKEPKRTLKTR